MMSCPCKDCFRRTVTCHGFCKEYKAWKAEADRRSETRLKAREGLPDIMCKRAKMALAKRAKRRT